MESKTSKKRTALLAAIVSVALLLTGTFAWVLQDDITLLNAFNNDNPGTYDVDLKENFKQWEQKQVWAENKGDNPIIVRIRFEEFFDLTYRKGSEYGLEKTNILEKTKGDIFKTETVTDLSAPSSTDLSKYITFKFGEGVVTMADYNAKKAANEDISGINWVIDTDGWCYYTKALTAADTNDPTNTAYRTTDLLKNVSLDEKAFRADFSEPFDLDYFVNVRLQAISADLEDFGSHLNDAQWTNSAYIDDSGVEQTDNAGRVITADKRSDSYEILADSTITTEALALVTGISYNGLTPYSRDFRNADGSVAVKVSNAEELKAALKDSSVHSILLTDNITYTECTDIKTAKLVDLGGYTITGTQEVQLFQIWDGGKLAFKHGNIENTLILSLQLGGDIELVGVDLEASYIGIFGLYDGGSIKLYDSKIESDGDTGIVLAADMDVTIENSDIIMSYKSDNHADERGYGTCIFANGDVTGTVLNVKNSNLLATNGYGIKSGTGLELNVSGSTISGCDYAVCDTHGYAPKSAVFDDCILKADNTGYFKVCDNPLTMNNCQVIIDDTDQSSGLGLFLRGGDVELNNVDIEVNSSNPATVYSDEEMDSSYNSMGGCNPNYEAMQIILNSYDSINLTINGGSYTTNVANARSVYAFDAKGTYDTGALKPGEEGDFSNSITIKGNPAFSPATDVFDRNYNFTTITK